MRFFIKPFTRLLMLLFLSCLSIATWAQETGAAKNTPNTSSSSNEMMILMLIIVFVLAFVIYGMGQVLITMGRQALEKNKEQNKIMSVVILIGLSLLSATANAQEQVATTTPKVVNNYGGLGYTGFWILFSVIAIEFIVIAFMMFFIRRLQVELLPEKIRKEQFAFKTWWSKLDKKIFTKAVAIEKEADVLLDHDYDGIKELNNALPPWWKYGFGITIVVAFVYLFNFHVMGYGKNPTEEYAAEINKAKEDKEAYEAKNADKVDESNIKMPSAEGIAAGKDIFTTTCWACHGKAGEGGAGPNLTDDYWLHKGSLADIYQSIKHGYPDKGMQAWEKNYSPKEISNIAGFIKTLKGTNPPNPKAAQGDLYTDTSSNTDSTNAHATISNSSDSSLSSQKSK